MSDLGPGEIVEHFAERLSQATDRLAADEMVKREAETSASAATRFLEEATLKADNSRDSLESAQRIVLSTIEAAAVDTGPREAVTATMAVKGKSKKEIEDYFSHVDRIKEESQPIAIIATDEKAFSLRGLVSATYGVTAYSSFPPSAEKNSINDGLVTLKPTGDPGSRELILPIQFIRGFRLGVPEKHLIPLNVFAGKPGDSKIEPTVANPNQPFEDVHFAGSAAEVDEITQSVIASDSRTAADRLALEALGVPTMVAYGEEAVRALSLKAGQRDRVRHVLIRRCIQGIGWDTVDLPPIDGLSVPAPAREEWHKEFNLALHTFLRGGDSKDGKASKILAFFAPLQSSIDFSPESVLNNIKHQTTAFYDLDEGRVITEDSSGPQAVEKSILATVVKLENVGVKSAPGANRVALSNAARSLKEKVIEDKLSFTPKHKFIKRQKLKKALARQTSSYLR